MLTREPGADEDTSNSTENCLPLRLSVSGIQGETFEKKFKLLRHDSFIWTASGCVALVFVYILNEMD